MKVLKEYLFLDSEGEWETTDSETFEGDWDWEGFVDSVVDAEGGEITSYYDDPGEEYAFIDFGAESAIALTVL